MIKRLFSIALFAGFAAFQLVSFPQAAFACPDIDGLVDVNCNGNILILCFGDSITYGTPFSPSLGYPAQLQATLPNVQIVNLGDPGERTFQGVGRAASVFPQYANVDYVIALEGVNDYWLFTSPTNTKNNLLTIIQTAQNLGAVTLLGKLTAVRNNYQGPWVDAVNFQIAPFSQIDFFALGQGIISNDLLHPDVPGYGQMATLAAARLLVISEENRPLDTDGDGMPDWAEIRDGTDPNEVDTDEDGLPDNEAFIYGTSPLNSDTDGDGFNDGLEVNTLESDPLDPRPSAPTINSMELIE